jgi:hypothetical protein
MWHEASAKDSLIRNWTNSRYFDSKIKQVHTFSRRWHGRFVFLFSFPEISLSPPTVQYCTRVSYVFKYAREKCGDGDGCVGLRLQQMMCVPLTEKHKHIL